MPIFRGIYSGTFPLNGPYFPLFNIPHTLTQISDKIPRGIDTWFLFLGVINTWM